MINFAACFTSGKAHGWGTFPKWKARLGFRLILGPLFWECPHPRALPYTEILAHHSLGKSNQQVSGVFNIDFLFAVKPCRVRRRQTHERGKTSKVLYCQFTTTRITAAPPGNSEILSLHDGFLYSSGNYTRIALRITSFMQDNGKRISKSAVSNLTTERIYMNGKC